MSDDTIPPVERPAFDALVADLRLLIRDQRVSKARATGAEVMAKAEQAFAEGRITAHDLNTLHAARLRLDAELPLPKGRRP